MRLSKAERKGFPGGSQQPLYQCRHETLDAEGQLQKTLNNIGLDPNFFKKKTILICSGFCSEVISSLDTEYFL